MNAALDEIIPGEFRAVAARIVSGGRITTEEAQELFDDAPLSLLGLLATEVRVRKNGRRAYYNRNFHIEPSNVCIFRCSFCSFRRGAGEEGAWDYTMQEVEQMARARAGSGVTEVHIVGGVHPVNGLEYYADIIRRVKAILPQATVKAFSAVELDYMIAKAGLSLAEGLRMLKDCGLGAIPGGGAEIFDERIRAEICPEKCSSERWLELHRTAHNEGIPTNATMLYGHIENRAHRIEHMDRLRKLQDETGGFNAFIPLKFRSAGNRLSAAGEVSVAEDMRTLAISRIFLDNFPHIKSYWAMYGRDVAQLALGYGADDLDGTIDDTTRIYSMAGAEEKRPSMSVEQMARLIEGAGYEPVERDSFYNSVY